MPSQITPTNINETFPVAGVDNDSTGFRTNFTGTKNNFIVAKREIEDLQNNVMLKSALTYGSGGSGTPTNLMNNAVISGSVLQDTGYAVVAHGTVTTSTTVTLDYSVGSYHTITLNGTGVSTALTLTNFPSPYFGELILEVVVQNTALTHTIGVSGITITNSTNVVGLAANVLKFPATGTYRLVFSSTDGTNFLLRLLSYNAANPVILRAAPANSNGAVGDFAGMIAYDASYLYVCTANYTTGGVAIWKRISLGSY